MYDYNIKFNLWCLKLYKLKTQFLTKILSKTLVAEFPQWIPSLVYIFSLHMPFTKQKASNCTSHKTCECRSVFEGIRITTLTVRQNKTSGATRRHRLPYPTLHRVHYSLKPLILAEQAQTFLLFHQQILTNVVFLE